MICKSAYEEIMAGRDSLLEGSNFHNARTFASPTIDLMNNAEYSVVYRWDD